MSEILARRRLRLTAKAVLEVLTGISVDSPGDWKVKPSRLPNIRLRVPSERKASVTKTIPEFTTTVSLEIMAILQAKTAEAAQDQIDALGVIIESAFFRAPTLVQMCQQFSTVSTQVEITAEGVQHEAQMLMTVDCEMFEDFEPRGFPALEMIDVHLDLLRPFDPSGTYPDPPFPASVTAAPRTTGPDGRDEGELQITLPQ